MHAHASTVNSSPMIACFMSLVTCRMSTSQSHRIGMHAVALHACPSHITIACRMLHDLFAGVRMVLSSLECIVLTSTLRCRFSVTGTYVHARFGNHRFSYGLLCMLHDAEHVTLFVAKLGRLHHGKSYTQTRCNFKNIVMQVSRRDCKNMMHNSQITVLALLLVNVFE